MRFLFSLVYNFNKNDVIGTAAQTAFFLILSLPPLLVLVLSVGTQFDFEILGSELVSYILPENIYNIINDVLTAVSPSAQLTLISGFSVVFSASGSIWALMKGIHKTYSDSDIKLGIKHRIITAVITIVFLLALVISLGTLIMSGVWSGMLQTLSGLEKSSLGLIGRLVSAAAVYYFVYLLYKYTPDNDLEGKDLFWGAFFSAFAWTAVSVFFEIYVTYFTKYTSFYGGVGAFFILILWLFIVSVIILTGAQINLSLLNHRQQG